MRTIMCSRFAYNAQAKAVETIRRLRAPRKFYDYTAIAALCHRLIHQADYI